MQYESMFKIVQDIAQRQQQSGAFITPDDTICVICGVSQRVYTGVSRAETRNGQPFNIHAEIIAMQQMQSAGEVIADSLLLVNTQSCRPILPCSGCIQYIISQNPENAKCRVVLPDRVILLCDIGKPAGSMPFNGQTSMYMNAGNMPYGGAMPQTSMYMNGSVPYHAAPQNSMYMNSMPYAGAVPAPQGFGQSVQTSQPYASANPAGGYMSSALPSGSQKIKNANADYLKNRVGSLMQVAEDDDDDEDEQENKGLFGKLFKR